ncbi:rho GTPase-activating protein 100F [Caerostris extrusa]|uniref:Rho GTPase-activating protein 100F n=1 Tax=Caerostris extrusa TaxID=172846 RepID=A0AAV4TPK4_CAEEX|nr:rho GTPase-activating protein 100F [Caerostris extrusa]
MEWSCSKYRPRAAITPVSVPPQGPRGHSGLLWIHLLSGRGLKPTGHADHFRDLYCVIECDRIHKARTVIRTGEHSFDWDEIFEIDLVENREVAFLLYTWDPRFRHKLCYKGTLHLSALLRESPVHSLALKLEPRGTLYLKLRYKSPTQTFQRMPAPSDTALFGADLERVLVREDSGYGVPLIVKSSVAPFVLSLVIYGLKIGLNVLGAPRGGGEGGLDIVGIYRLCGSALRKRLLREDFERNTLMANLSVEHVPDINVVTSLLKDYLRELPEPLLSRSLYDMLVDGLSVCLPDDPDGSAKLMFSILECLPKANLTNLFNRKYITFDFFVNVQEACYVEDAITMLLHCFVVAGSPPPDRQSLRPQQDDAPGTGDGLRSGAHVPRRDSHCHSRHPTTHRHYELLGRDVAQQEKWLKKHPQNLPAAPVHVALLPASRAFLFLLLTSETMSPQAIISENAELLKTFCYRCYHATTFYNSQ